MVTQSIIVKALIYVAVLAYSATAFGVPANRRQFLVEAVGGASALVASQAASAAAPPSEYYTPAEHSLDGKLMVVTGGTAGLGLETVKRLAAGGASVVLTARSDAKGAAAVGDVKDYLKTRGVSNDKVYSVILDLDDLASVKTFTDRLTATVGSQKTNVLVNNAGVMAIPDLQSTKDGFERTFQSNHLGHFVLTAKMMDKLAPDARVINVSSEAYQIAKSIDFDNLNGETKYDPWGSYGQSKLANILFTRELKKRADEAGRPLTTYALHPGMVQTDLARNMMGPEKWEKQKTEGVKGFDSILLNGLSKFIKPVEDGASTQIYLAAEGKLPATANGEYFSDVKQKKVGSAATDMDAADKLWAVSERLGKVDFKL